MKFSLASSKLLHVFLISLVTISVCLVLSIFVTKAYSTDEISHTETASHQAKSSEATKWGFFSAALATGLSTIGAAIAVGLVGSSAMGALSEKPEMAGRALIFVGLAEGIAIYGLIVTIMILGKI